MLNKLKRTFLKYYSEEKWQYVYDEQGRNVGLKKIESAPKFWRIPFLMLQALFKKLKSILNSQRELQLSFGEHLAKELGMPALPSAEEMIAHYKPFEWPITTIIPPIPKEIRENIGEVVITLEQFRELVPSLEQREYIIRYYSKDFTKFRIWSYNDWKY